MIWHRYLIVSLFFFSCKKQEPAKTIFSEASYSITLTGQWKNPEFSVPPSVHFTSFAGMIHNKNTYLWKLTALASKGVENVAEIGNATVLFTEVDSIMKLNMALSSISIAAPPPTGMSNKTVLLNTDFSRISFISMIAPSPDWFVGINSLDLYQNNQWITDTLIHLYVHDAGTEEGDVFGYNNPATIPQQNIFLLTPDKATSLSNGNPSLKPIATVRFTKQ